MLQSITLAQNAPPQLASAAWDATALTMPLPAGHIWASCDDGATLAIYCIDAHTLLRRIAGRFNEAPDLLVELHTMQQASSWSYLIVIGSYSRDHSDCVVCDKTPTRWRWESLEGYLLSVAELGVAYCGAADWSEVPALVRRLARRDRQTRRARPSRGLLFVTPGEDMLLALPGIGEDRVASLLRFCGGSTALALVALTSDGAPGVGPKTITEARKALGLRDDQQLALVIREEESSTVIDTVLADNVIPF